MKGENKKETPRIINDFYVRSEKPIWGDDANLEFNKVIVAVNNMYGYLLERGILEKVAFEYKEYPNDVSFALNVADIEEYREEMLNSGVENAALAVEHIFDVDYTPCHFCGAITLSWTMKTYRDNSGCVGSSWECDYCQMFDWDIIHKIRDKKEEGGIIAAVKESWKHIVWKEMPPSQLREVENNMQARKLAIYEQKAKED